jgi:hypothetical protein
MSVLPFDTVDAAWYVLSLPSASQVMGIYVMALTGMLIFGQDTNPCSNSPHAPPGVQADPAINSLPKLACLPYPVRRRPSSGGAFCPLAFLRLCVGCRINAQPRLVNSADCASFSLIQYARASTLTLPPFTRLLLSPHPGLKARTRQPRYCISQLCILQQQRRASLSSAWRQTTASHAHL